MDGLLSPTEIYLDSSLMIAAMIDGLPHSGACSQFCARLAADNSHVFFSQIARLEIAEAIRKLATRAQLPEDLRQEYQLGRWAVDSLIRQQWMAFGMAQFATLISKFYRVSELPFRIRMWRRSVQIMGRYALGSHDAMHVATALQNGIEIFATSDRHFSRVDAFDVWLVLDLPEGA